MKMRKDHTHIVGYAIWDNVTSEGLSAYPKYKWDGSFNDNGRAEDFHLFMTFDEAEQVVKELTKVFLDSDSSNKINFEIFELSSPKSSYKVRSTKHK